MGRRQIRLAAMASSAVWMAFALPLPFPSATGQDPAVPTAEPAPPVEARPAPVDDQVQRAGAEAAATGTPAGANPAAPSNAQEAQESGNSLVERLQVGKQDVSVSVQVQGPADLNLNKPAPFKIIVRNTGTTDAFQVMVRDELPPGLEHVDSEPKALQVGPLLSWKIDTLHGGDEKIITLKLKPTAKKAADHAATVTFLTGSKSRTQIHEPTLKVTQSVSSERVLKGQNVEFRIEVRNTGDGPARDVTVQAKLSPGLRHETGSPANEDTVYEFVIPEIGAGQIQRLDPLVVDTTQGGEQWCKVTATSEDVEPHKPEDAEMVSKIEVVEPKLQMTLSGPTKRFTDSIAPYKIVVENPGTAPAKNVVVIASLPTDAVLRKVPANAEYDKSRRRLRWTFPEIRPGGKAPEMAFETRMDGVGRRDIVADARADNGLADNEVAHTDVQGMPDVGVIVVEKRRNVDVGGDTVFMIKLQNRGTKDAEKLTVKAVATENLEIVELAGGSGMGDSRLEKENGVQFATIEHLGTGKEIQLGVRVKVKDAKLRRATCKVSVTHDDFSEPVEGSASFTVTNSGDLSQNP